MDPGFETNKNPKNNKNLNFSGYTSIERKMHTFKLNQHILKFFIT